MTRCAPDRPPNRPTKTVAFLLSCCLCLSVICACLVTALVFVGRHILHNQPPARRTPGRGVATPPDKLLVAPPRYRRLPGDARPLSYDLTLLPDLSAGKFDGWVNVTVKVTGFRKDLIVHSKNLTINEVRLLRGDGRHMRVISVNEVQEDEVLIVTTREKIFPDTYYLFLGFEGSLTDRLTGFYRSEYGRAGGKAR